MTWLSDRGFQKINYGGDNLQLLTHLKFLLLNFIFQTIYCVKFDYILR